MKNEIINIIKHNISQIDNEKEQKDLAIFFFNLSELCKDDAFYDLLMDAFLLAKNDKNNKHLYTCEKTDLLKKVDSLLNQNNYSEKKSNTRR